MAIEACENCRWYAPNNYPYGFCRHGSPSLNPHDVQQGEFRPTAVWPTVHYSAGCGKHEPKREGGEDEP